MYTVIAPQDPPREEEEADDRDNLVLRVYDAEEGVRHTFMAAGPPIWDPTERAGWYMGMPVRFFIRRTWLFLHVRTDPYDFEPWDPLLP
eukprot:CAMPEP_0113721328 /NCGR_PEP_ID=MMETSP0038_2-20120614/37067_1 /TAXON_ID=2898 /ORGANISM="Cryptomonas paramecium" /LENGTH=88 /DNA_ID=CAMNT_0000650315 /DNA_START=312 /DNA_END=576 /DNA_ORIENTATION=+ /assembly_acc=CAM_ASM_000170